MSPRGEKGEGAPPHYGFSSINTIGFSPDGPLFGPPGYEINLLYIAGLVALIFSAPTAFSLDRWLACGNRSADARPLS